MENLTLRLTATSLLTKEINGVQTIVGMRCGYTATSSADSEFPFEMSGTVGLTSDEISEFAFNKLDKAVAKRLAEIFGGVKE